MSARNPFRASGLAAMFTACLEHAADNFSEFYVPAGRSPLGPRAPRGGAGHRVAFWHGYRGVASLSDGTRGGKGTFQFAAYRAGQAFAKGASK